MRVFFVLGITVVVIAIFCRTVAADQKVNDATKKEAGIDKKIDFPYQIPNSQTDLDRDLVDKLNQFNTKEKQIKYLLSDLLPDKDAKNKLLTDKELHAIRLLGLTASKNAVQPLIERLEFKHQKDGAPAVHALAQLGQVAVEPLVAELQNAHSLRLNMVVMALRDIHTDKFTAFVEKQKKRTDIKLSKQAIDMLDLFSKTRIR